MISQPQDLSGLHALRTGGPCSVVLDFLPQDRSVHHVRVMSHSFGLLLGMEQSGAARLMLAAAELVEAVGRPFFSSGCQLRLRAESQGRKVSLELSGTPSDDGARALEEAVQLTNRGTGAEAYTRALARTATTAEEFLGLARIRYEAQLSLSARRQGRQVWVLAQTGS